MLIASGRSLLRLGFLSLVVLSGCSGKPAVGALEVQVNLEAGLISKCVKVTATDGTSPRETMPILLAGKTSPLRVGIVAEGLSQSVNVQALGYSDDGCTTRVATEFSEKADGTFSSPRGTVSVTLRANPVSSTDGGTDAGNDAGVDAGIDNDGDGFPQGDDCDDGNPAINRNATELCNNGIDDDCDSAADCQDTAACNAQPCGAGSTCVSGVCMGATEFPCNDGLDNNGNGRIDCADPGCMPGTICSDFNECTLGDRCVSDGGCEKVGDFNCTNPPNMQCYGGGGTCTSDGGAICSYTPVAGNCVDGLACTDMDTCTGGTCAGTERTCNTPPNVCFSSTGACQEPSGTCVYTPRPVGARTCDDGVNCTINDTCDGDGGCVGTAVTCPAPTQCQVSNGCSVAGACLFNARGGACDAGTGAGTCDNSFNCIANPTSLFPFAPSNFAEAQLPADAGTAFTISCATTINTSDTPAITNGACVTMPPFAIITQGGESTLLIRVRSLTVNSSQTLSIVGTRPVIFAVTGDVVIDGTIRARNGSGLSSCGNGGNGDGSGSGNGLGGGAGGAFGSAGAQGGNAGGAGGGTAPAPNGTATLIPLRGGCNGGEGAATGSGGVGGGAVQVTSSGSITVAGLISAPGRGGLGAIASMGNSGGGAGSGGAILLEAATLFLNSSARVTANGGAGGEGSGGGVGADGNDGNELSGNPTPNGGNNSPNGGNGGVGAGLANAAGAGLSGSSQNDGAGGGGGGVGRIRINASTSCTVATSGLVVSPAATGSGAPGCPGP